jgi:2-oxoglutarate ferredoxin oxidoreductase subunit alpha
VIVLVPSSAQEAFDLTVKAFNLAEVYRNPVILLTDEIVGHTREKVRIPEKVEIVERRKPATHPANYVPFRSASKGLLDGMPAFNQGYGILVDGQLHDEFGGRAGHKPEVSAAMVERICRKITDRADELVDVEEGMLEDAEIALIAFGSPARPALRAAKDARTQGIKAGFLKLRVLWPFPDKVIERVARQAKRIIVPEMNMGKIFREVKRVVGGRTEVVSLPKLGGEVHTPMEILKSMSNDH